jgi:hypothetical protein
MQILIFTYPESQNLKLLHIFIRIRILLVKYPLHKYNFFLDLQSLFVIFLHLHYRIFTYSDISMLLQL